MTDSSTACALGRSGNSCLLDEEIHVLADAYNAWLAATAGNAEDKASKRMSGPTIMQMLQSKTACASEECVVCKLLEAVRGTVYEPVVLRIKEIAFKAAGPAELTALLDNFLIIRLCRQLEANNEGVRFAGVLTADFMIPPLISRYGQPAAVWTDWREKGWKQLQFVFNIDHRMGGGQHWTALVIDMESREMQYFDSFGAQPPNGLVHASRPYDSITDEKGRFLSLLKRWIEDVAKQAPSKPLAVVCNTTQHQAVTDRSNCGPYSVLFLALRARRVPFDRINREAITMPVIERMRDRLYRRTPDYQPLPPTS